MPRKCFLDLGGRSILEHVIYRCRSFDLTPVVATTRADEEIIEVCSHERIMCHAGSVRDKLARWHAACNRFGITDFITVDCDDPLFDGELAHATYDLLLKRSRVIKPDPDAYLGSMGWGMTWNALDVICEKKASVDTEMIWKHFPPEIGAVQFDAKADWLEKKIRLTLDYEDDLAVIRTVWRELGGKVDRNRIINFFRDNPGLSVVNEWRNAEWKQLQEA